MNKDIEKRFIETFIVKNKKDRLLFELSGKTAPQRYILI